MKKFIPFLLIISVFLFSCGGGGEKATKLKPGTKEYKLAQKLAKKVPKLNPDENNVLASSKSFKLTTGDVITKWYSLAGDRIQQLSQFDSTQITRSLKSAIQQISVSELLSKKADEKGINIEKSKIDSILQQQYQRAGGKKKFQQRLSQRGITEKTLRESILQNMRRENFLNSEIDSSFEPTQQEIKQVYKQKYKNQQKVSARHILVKEKDSTQKGQGLQKIKQVKKKIENGANFAEMAKQYSEGPSSRKGGDLGSFGKQKMDPRFTRAAFSLEKGEVSDVVKTRYGYHLIQVYDKKTTSKPLSQVRSKIVQQLKDQKKQQARSKLIQKLKKDANLQIKI